MVQFGRKAFGMCAIEFDELDRVLVFECFGEPLSDVAAAPEHDAPDGLVHTPQLTHDTADIFRGSDEKYLISVLDYRSSARNDGCVLPEDCGDPRLDIRH